LKKKVSSDKRYVAEVNMFIFCSGFPLSFALGEKNNFNRRDIMTIIKEIKV